MAGKPWFLYLIECQDGSIYTGITVNVASRYAAHEAGKGARYTRSHPPRCLLAVLEYADRSAASKAEYAMKKLTAAEKRRYATIRCPPAHLPTTNAT
jgi:putative endonuclease